MSRDVLRLATLLACVALATSRLGLIVHELVGHGGTALVLGAKIREVRLFWFAGGWIRYELAEPSIVAALAISMGGIAVELAAGTAIWLAARRDTLGVRILRGVGAALIVHAGWYLATGAWHGFGDGVLLYRVLGSARHAIAITAGGLACVAAFAGARVCLGGLAGTLPRHRVAGTIAAVVLAGGLHLGLAAGELHLRRDATYTATMQSERERVIAREMARWAAEHPEVQPELRAQQAQRVAREHRTFPFAWLLAAAILASVIAGAMRARPGVGDPPSRRLQAIAAAIAVASICGVIAIGLVATM